MWEVKRILGGRVCSDLLFFWGTFFSGGWGGAIPQYVVGGFRAKFMKLYGELTLIHGSWLCPPAFGGPSAGLDVMMVLQGSICRAYVGIVEWDMFEGRGLMAR